MAFLIFRLLQKQYSINKSKVFKLKTPELISKGVWVSNFLLALNNKLIKFSTLSRMSKDNSKNTNLFADSKPFKLIISLFSLVFSLANFSFFADKTHVFSFKGCSPKSSAWKTLRRGAASLLFLIIILLLVTTTLGLPQITTDKTIYTRGEKVLITIDNATNDSELTIINGENIYKFVGELHHQTEFLPQHTGEFIISLEYEYYKEVRTNFYVEPQPELTPRQSIMQGIYTPSVLDTSAGSASTPDSQLPIKNLEETEGITISKEWLVIKKHNQEIVEKTMDLYDFKTGKKYSTTKNAQRAPIGPYDTEVSIKNHPIKKIFFRNLEIRGSNQLELRIDDLTGNAEKAGTGSKQFYVIDPTSLNFTNATVTVTAKGESLRKCKEWNYSEQRCEGSWKYIMDLTPGENYTFLLTPDDPAYNETAHDADDCYNEIALSACTSSQVSAISADGGTTYTFNKNEGNPIRVSFANESASIGTIVDCTVYVKGYDSESNTWTLQRGNWSTSTWDGPGTGQTAPSPEGTISWDCTNHFGTSNDEALFDDFAVRISTADRSRPATAYIDHIYVVINFSIPDTEAPYYSNIMAGPSSPATYDPSGSYQFNTTWQDNEGVNTTWIEHNFTGGAPANHSITSSTGNVYYYNYGNIAAGSYAWRTYSNDTAGNTNSSMPWQTYTINKANSTIQLLLNNSESNFTINNSGSANITGKLIQGQGNITIYEEGAQITYGASPQNIIRTYTSTGDYNITLVYAATQNYTSNQTTYYVSVQDTIPPGQVTSLNESITGETWILWNWTNPSDNDFDHVEVWINNSFEANTTNQYYNASGLMSDTTHEIQIRSVDNWTSPNKGGFVNDTATTQTSADITPPVISNVQNTSITDSNVNISWDTDEPSNSLVKYGTSPGTYTNTSFYASLVENHSVILTGLDSTTTYYYVVNSTDSAGNSNQSIEYGFTTLADQTNPWYSNITASPSSPATYSPTASYQFNTTWQDNEGVNTTWIEHNFTGGAPANHSITSSTGNVYYYNYGNIAAGSYAWRTYSNDTAGNTNSSMPWQTYTINKAKGEVNLLLNNTDNNYSINESQSVNITGILVSGETNITIYENASILVNGSSPLTSIRTYNAPGTWNITLEYIDTENYTGSKETHFIQVNDTRAPWINLTDPPDDSTDTDGDVIFWFDVNDTSPVQNCTLYLNGTKNKTKEIIAKGENSISVNDLKNGNYTWYVNCSDYSDHTNTSQTWNLTVEISEYFPTLTPETCSDDSGGCTASNLNNTPNQWEEHGSLEKGTSQTNYVYINFTQASISAGSTIHWMYIYYDKYQETTSGYLKLEWLNGTSWDTDAVTICTRNFGSSTYHGHDAENCSFAKETMPGLSQLNSGLQLRAEFYYSDNPAGNQYGTDEAYINLKYTEDVTPPTVELISPNTCHRPGEVNFTYRSSDANLVNCTLYGDFNGTWLPNQTDTNVVSDAVENFTLTLDEGYYTWNVYCCDIAENCAFDQLGGPENNGNYTVNITNPDLIVSDINFNTPDSQTRQGMNITINATILNQGNVNATETFKVQFFIGDPDSGGTQINGNKTINGLNIKQNKTVNVTWIIDQGGPRKIFVVVDPPLASNGMVEETLEDNNKANKTLHVPAYNYFYGKVKNNIKLSNKYNQALYYYLGITNVSGNIIAADDESIISFANLQAMGRDINDNIASNDFNNTDAALNMTDYNDSIRWTYTRNTDAPIATTTITAYNKQIQNVPVINSTNTSNFQTGILWDKSDGGTQYNGTQDIIFITQINHNQPGAYGTYDYEIRIPVNLKKYLAPESTIKFYWEITNSSKS